jgi:hypothetical protein
VHPHPYGVHEHPSNSGALAPQNALPVGHLHAFVETLPGPPCPQSTSVHPNHRIRKSLSDDSKPIRSGGLADLVGVPATRGQILQGSYAPGGWIVEGEGVKWGSGDGRRGDGVEECAETLGEAVRARGLRIPVGILCPSLSPFLSQRAPLPKSIRFQKPVTPTLSARYALFESIRFCTECVGHFGESFHHGNLHAPKNPNR